MSEAKSLATSKRPGKRRLWVLAWPFFFFALAGWGLDSAHAQSLDQKAIHTAYNDGDFDKVIKALESFNAKNPKTTRGDSIFIAKHLAVVYSANPETREKGKYYMYRLLEMMPSAELVDMFVSDEVDRIFDKVRKEYLVRQQNFGIDSSKVGLPNRPADGTFAASASATPNSGTSSPAASSSSSSLSSSPSASARSKGMDPVWWWIGGGVVALGAGLTAALILSQPAEEKPPVYTVEF